MSKRTTPPGQLIYTSYAYSRPSLDFYSDRRVLPATDSSLQEHWQQDTQPFLLLDQEALKRLGLPKMQRLGEAEGWSLVTHPPLITQ
ncbi:hypothetical protein [Neosynechococcus sphagnicola]|uniref:hypothetical protein n=1 Tax=Neosynechococcus sphagnicola TaxID=1501145 RepID=UPI001955353D|nr:hypothetical protein [Neosynechococcus sphagnicola]